VRRGALKTWEEPPRPSGKQAAGDDPVTGNFRLSWRMTKCFSRPMRTAYVTLNLVLLRWRSRSKKGRRSAAFRSAPKVFSPAAAGGVQTDGVCTFFIRLVGLQGVVFPAADGADFALHRLGDGFLIADHT